VKVVFEVSGLVRPEPERVPELDQGPPAVHEVAPEEDQVRVDRPLYISGFGEAVREAVTGFASEQLAVVPPLAPRQDQVYAVGPFALLALVPVEQE